MLSEPAILDGFSLDSVKERGAFSAAVGCALGAALDSGQLQPYGLVYSWQPVAIIKGRPISSLDCALEGMQILLLDVKPWCSHLQCPGCHEELLRSNGWHDNATSSKGGGFSPTLFTCSKKRICTGCKRTCMDSALLDQLPHGIRNLVPVESSSYSGLPRSVRDSLMALAPDGVPFSTLARSFNQELLADHAQQEAAFYGRLLEHVQVCTECGPSMVCL